MKYEIVGESLPVLKVRLESGESIQCQRGAMSWMDPGIKMNTNFGGIKKIISRSIRKEPLFMNQYTAETAGEIAFATALPGSIVAIELDGTNSVVVQKGAFLAAVGNVEQKVWFQKRLRSALFGGEGFIMEKLTGKGIAFIEVDGSAVEYTLASGVSKIVDTGHLVMVENTTSIDIQMVKGVKNMFFGGEGVFNTVVQGPGRIILQSMPIQKTAAELRKHLVVRSESSTNSSHTYND